MGRQHVDVDHLTPQDLDELSRFIADALQVVDRDQGLNGGGPRVRPGPRDLGAELNDRGEGEEGEGGVRDEEEEEELLEDAPTLTPRERSPAAPADLQGDLKRFIFAFVFVVVGFFSLGLLSKTLKPRWDTCVVVYVGLENNKKRHSKRTAAKQ